MKNYEPKADIIIMDRQFLLPKDMRFWKKKMKNKVKKQNLLHTDDPSALTG